MKLRARSPSRHHTGGIYLGRTTVAAVEQLQLSKQAQQVIEKLDEEVLKAFLKHLSVHPFRGWRVKESTKLEDHWRVTILYVNDTRDALFSAHILSCEGVARVQPQNNDMLNQQQHADFVYLELPTSSMLASLRRKPPVKLMSRRTCLIRTMFALIVVFIIITLYVLGLCQVNQTRYCNW